MCNDPSDQTRSRLLGVGAPDILTRRLRSFAGWVEQPDDQEAPAGERSMDTVFVRAFDALVVWVVSVSSASIALLALSAYDATIAVIGGTFVSTVVWFFTPARFTPARLDTEWAVPGRPVLPILVLVVLATLLFRTEPFRTMHGGEDQGVYVAMSSYLQREGTVFIDDRLPEVLPDPSREIYQAKLWSGPPVGFSVQPGVFYWYDDQYIFQFYHLHPIWMATFAELLGDGARFYSVTFFGLLSVLGLCLLTLELTSSRLAMLATGLLLAVNPLHAYFSRFQATEVVALAFSSVGFYYLARAFRGMRDSAPAPAVTTLLTLAATSLSLVFFVRITGFLYLPVLVPLFGVGVWWMLEGRRRDGRRIVGFCAAVAALYSLSVLYGLGYSLIYVLGIYRQTFGNLLGADWALFTLGAAGATVAAMGALAWNREHPPVRRLLSWAAGTRPWVWLGTAAVAAAVLGSLYQAYVIGFTDRYADDAFVSAFGIVGAGASIFLQSGAAGWLLYASPPLVVILVWGMHRPGRSAAEALLYVFVAVCLAATIVFHVPVIYQHYWWARYLLSEIVPYSIVLAVTLTALAGPGAFRWLGVVAILAAMPFHLYYTAKQMPVRHGSLPYAVLSRIADRVGEGVLLLDVDGFGDGPHVRLQTPLNLYFGTHVFPYDADELDAIVQSFEGVPDANLWLLTNSHNGHPELRLSETFPYRDHRMVRASTIPTTISERFWNQTLVLYRHETCAGPDCELRLRDRALYSLGHGYIYHQMMLGDGWYGAEERHVWSGSQATLRLSRSWFPSSEWPAAVLLETRAFAASPDHPVTVTARSSGVEHVIRFDRGQTALREVPLGCADSDVCTLQLEIDGARSPRELYDAADARTLGIAVNRIGFSF